MGFRLDLSSSTLLITNYIHSMVRVGSNPVPQVLLGLLVLVGLQELAERQVLQELEEHQVLQELAVFKGFKVHRVRPGLKAQ